MTPARIENTVLTTVSMLIIATVAIAAALSYTRPVMVPFVLAVFISYLVSPLVDILRTRYRWPNALAVFLTLLVVAGMIFLIGVLITTSVRGIVANADLYRERLVSLTEQGFRLLERVGVPLGAELEDAEQDVVESIRRLPIFGWVGRAAGTAVGLVTNGFLVMIFVIYLLLGRQPNRLRRGLYREIDIKVRRYLIMKLIISASTGLLVGAVLAIMGLDLALVFGVLAFLLNFVPSIGSVIATLLPLPIALIQFESALLITLAILIPGAIQVTIGNVIEPLVMGEGLDLHPVTILMALIFWGLLWGVVGMLLATPITAVLKIVFARLEITRPVSELLAGRLPPVLLATEDFTPEATPVMSNPD